MAARPARKVDRAASKAILAGAGVLFATSASDAAASTARWSRAGLPRSSRKRPPKPASRLAKAEPMMIGAAWAGTTAPQTLWSGWSLVILEAISR
jgi:hypothetical protein